MSPALSFLLAFAASLAAALLLVRRIMAAAVLDVPNERSSHDTPVPRGGGAAIVIVALAALPPAGWWFGLPAGTAAVLAGVLLLLGGVGWLDDRYQLSIAWRLPVQVAAGLLVLWGMGSLEMVSIGGVTLPLGWLGVPFTLLWIVWMSNLYNFMDGIDGIAAVETLVAAVAIGFWFADSGALGLALFCVALAGGTAGFLWFNRPPARIFMGDVGSATLGGLFAALAVAAVVQFNFPLGVFLILFGCFIYDATFTLLRRMLAGEKWWRPHRSHLYQRAAAGLGHGRVTAVVLLLNVALALLATLELRGVAPRPLWPLLALLLLLGAHGLVRRQDRRHPAS